MFRALHIPHIYKINEVEGVLLEKQGEQDSEREN